jgi:rRNA maturation protein Nop10
MELINCHDCGRCVSFTAASCPHCGSIEPAGPYRFNRKEARRHRIEERNDRTLILMTVGFGAVGAFYGVEISSSASHLNAILPDGRSWVHRLQNRMVLCSSMPTVIIDTRQATKARRLVSR